MQNKINSPTPASPADDQTTPDRPALIARLGLPASTTNEELKIILLANEGDSLPVKPGVVLALVDFVTDQTHLSPDDALEFIVNKFPMLKTASGASGDEKIPNNSAAFLAHLGLPVDTDDAELNVVLQANGGSLLPLKKAVYTAMLAHTMRVKGLPEDEAREYVARKFPSLNPPDGHTKSQDQANDALRAELIRLYGLPADATAEDITAAATAEKNANVADKARRSQEEADETIIAQKKSTGLTREQAIGVTKRQREHDEELARQRAQRKPRLLEIIKTYGKDLREARKIARDELSLHEGSEWNDAVAELKAAGELP